MIDAVDQNNKELDIELGFTEVISLGTHTFNNVKEDFDFSIDTSA